MDDQFNDFNLVVLCGKLAVEPEYRAYGSGARLIRYLIATRSSEPLRRMDVIPVTQWDPPEELWTRQSARGDRLTIVGSVQRRFHRSDNGREGRLEVVASNVEFGGASEAA